MKERLHWVDIAKGLMILGMVLNHIPNICNSQGVDLSAFPWIVFGGAYGVFTMQSFFILSGYTSNFTENPKSFLIKQTKGLLLPYFSFTLICSFFAYIVWGDPFFYESFGERCFVLFDSFWFLTSLFVAKLFAYLFHRLFKNVILEMGGGILLLIIGIVISELYSDMPEPSHWHNWFHYRNGLCMTIFITIGSLLKKYNLIEKWGKVMAISYCVFYMSLKVLRHFVRNDVLTYFEAPCYTHYLDPNLSDVNGLLIIPSFLFYATTGSVLIFIISKFLGKCSILEFLGKTSLVIYCVHFVILRMVVDFVSPLFHTDSMLSAGLMFLVIAVLTVTISTGVAFVFNKKPMKYVIGKF